jgi:MoCo/4Fe-4S cofactor protein with predicted Tat translocation signal
MSSLGKDYWRSLEERASSPEFERWLHGEFPAAADLPGDELGRRDFLRLMGASMALAGLGACTKQPIEKIVPYVKQPEELVPGKPLHFATATTFGGYAQGVIVRSNEGRPTKIEGNPDHPASLGATSIWAQADLLDLYDPDRAQAINKRGQISTWDDFLQQLTQLLSAQSITGGAGLRILTLTITSPTLLGQIGAVLKKYPAARRSQWDPLPRGASDSEELIYNFADATTIVALDSDFLSAHPAALRHTRDFASARRMTNPDEANMSRFYAAEPTPTITGSNADHRIAIESREIGRIAQALAAVVSGGSADSSLPGPIGKWVAAAAADLLENPGAGVVIAGETQPVSVHGLVREINDTLGNLGTTISPRPAIALHPSDPVASLRSLVQEMNSGAVKLLLILDGDPVYDSPAELEFEKALAGVETSIHHSVFFNQTSKASRWHLPAAHFLESWSDALAFDGTATIIQPLIEPLYAGKTAHEVLEALIQQPVRSAYEIVHQSWAQRGSKPDFEARWNDAVQRGVAPEPKRAANKSVREREANSFPHRVDDHRSPLQGLEILFRADPNVLDGRYANNGWIQELPRPFSKLTWDNAALVSPALADELRLSSGDVVELEFRGRKIFAPIWIQPGQARHSVTVHLGYGRSEIGRVGKGVGFNAYALRTSDAMWSGDGLTIRKTTQPSHKFAATQLHHSIEGRHMFRAGTLTQFQSDPEFAPHETEVPKHDETLYNPDEFKKAGYAWGMAIDLNTCTGCNACTIACQAENNIPVVGKYQVSVGREMHWIRVDNYFEGAPANPEMNHQPVPCMHCEHAPCELVCPVGATVHDDEGLNLQVYNRCVGTRYCSNNCPYKVRRFNFLELNGKLSSTEKLSKNPDVTVRSRGVMEKCTYCLQRINAARFAAELQNRSIRDGEVVPACAQVCPAEAIVFGNIADPESREFALKK